MRVQKTTDKNTTGKKWTMAVYMAGDNNLSGEMVWGLQEMRRALAAKPGVGVVVLYDASGLRPRVLNMNKGLDKSGADGTLEETVLKEFSTRELIASSSDPASQRSPGLSSPEMMRLFVKQQVDFAWQEGMSADRFLVVLSGHGGGITGRFLPDEDGPQSSLTIPKLAQILENASGEGKDKVRIEILGMDSCLMNMAEIGYEIQNSVKYLVSSEGVVFQSGWPYHRVVEVLADAGQTNARSVAGNIVQKYAAFYQDYEMGGLSTHMAALDLEKIGTPDKHGSLAEAIRSLAENLTEVLNGLAENENVELHELEGKNARGREVRDALILAHWYAQSFNGEKYVDLYDFCDQLLRFLPAAGFTADTIRSSCDTVKRRIKDVVVRSYYCGPDYQHAHGISVFLPWSLQDFSPEYRQLRFARETRWYDFLAAYLRATRRSRRGQADVPPNAEPWRFGSDLVIAERGDLGVANRGDLGVANRGDLGVANRGDLGVANRMAGGKLLVTPNLKNPPDGFFRLNIEKKEEEFLAKNQAALESPSHQRGSRPRRKVATYSKK